MRIVRTWIIHRVKQTSWNRGQDAPRATAGHPAISPVVAVVGIKGDPAVPYDPSDLAGWYLLQKEL
jgi:hypothetical protein